MKKGYKVLLVLSLFINVFILIVSIQSIADKGVIKNKSLVESKALKTGRVAVVNTDKPERVKEFEKYQSTEKDVIFLGDSIIQGGSWSEYFPGLSVRNRGIDGEGTESILNRLDSIVKGCPRKIFLLVGINDLAANLGYEKILDNYENIIRTIQCRTPKTKIYVGSIMPINLKKLKDILEKKTNMVIPITNENIKTMNTQLKALCEKTAVIYIDYYPHLIDGQELKAEITTDGLHLKPDGYLILSNVIKPYLR
ncbi:MAG: GDSL-type esterase/lipase family protein [Desulfitobacteriaceae bacterium]